MKSTGLSRSDRVHRPLEDVLLFPFCHIKGKKQPHSACQSSQKGTELLLFLVFDLRCLNCTHTHAAGLVALRLQQCQGKPSLHVLAWISTLCKTPIYIYDTDTLKFFINPLKNLALNHKAALVRCDRNYLMEIVTFTHM